MVVEFRFDIENEWMQVICIAVEGLYVQPVRLVQPSILFFQQLQLLSQPLDLIHVRLVAALTAGVARVIGGV